MQRFAGRVLQALARQHHQRSAHARQHVPGDHAFRRAVVDEGAGTIGLEAQHHFLARRDQRQAGTAQRPGGRMQVDVVRHAVGGRVDQGDFHEVTFVYYHRRAGHRAIEGHCLQGGALVVDDHLLFFDDQAELDHAGFLRCHLLVDVHLRRRNQIDLHVGQSVDCIRQCLTAKRQSHRQR